MLKIQGNFLLVELPEGKTQEELINICKDKFANIETECYGKDIQVNGRITTGMALFLGHKLAHVCKTVSIFDPKENAYIKCIWH